MDKPNFDDKSLTDLVSQIKAVSDNISEADDLTKKSFEEIKTALEASNTKVLMLEKKSADAEETINEFIKKYSRPAGRDEKDEEIIRKSALELLRTKHELDIRKKDPQFPFDPKDTDIEGAIEYSKSFKRLFDTPYNSSAFPEECKKSLSAFNFGTNQFMLEPKMASEVISCITEPTDLGGLFSSMTISAPSVKFMVDNTRMAIAAWACEASCFANNPQPDLADGIGEIEIKPETLRFIVCSSRDLLEDASSNLEQWIFRRVSDGFRATFNYSFLLGDGIGKPLGILNANAGIPICDTSPNTPLGQFTWQDLVMLKYELPMQWIGAGSYLMNQRTFAQLMTMSDTNTRPLWTQLPGGEPGFTFCGSPIRIVSQMPDIAPGACPVGFGDWKRTYMIVWRKNITMQQDPYSAGYCVLFKFEARVGAGVLCPNAARWLRIR